MPAVEKASGEDIVSAASEILRAHGSAAVTMSAVAEAVGVKAPSLYKRFSNRAALMSAVADRAMADVRSATSQAARNAADDASALRAIARATREYAHHNRHAYALIFGPAERTERASDTARDGAIAVLSDLTKNLVGDSDALNAARLLTAWLTGFVAMELGDAFQADGDIEQSFEWGLDALLASLGARV